MFRYIIIFLLLWPFKTLGQPAGVKNIQWIGADFSSFELSDDSTLNMRFDEMAIYTKYQYIGDTLMLVNEYYTIDKWSKTLHVDTSKFFTRLDGNRQLIVRPLNASARKMAPQSEYRFRNLKNIKDKTVKFNRIRFSVSWCKGNERGMRLDVDSHGNYHLLGGPFANAEQFQFKGVMSRLQLDTLTQILQNSLIRQMHSWHPKFTVLDINSVDIVIEYEDKALKINAPILPINMQNFVTFMLQSPYKLKLTPTREPHVFYW